MEGSANEGARCQPQAAECSAHPCHCSCGRRQRTASSHGGCLASSSVRARSRCLSWRRRAAPERGVSHLGLLLLVLAAILDHRATTADAFFDFDSGQKFPGYNGPPIIIERPKNVTVEQGDPFNISCVVKAGPLPLTLLLRNGRPVEYKHKVDEKKRNSTWNLQEIVYAVAEATSVDDGTYVCRVVSKNGLRAQATAYVRVLGKSKPRLVTSPNKLTTEGRNIRLTCKASGLPKPKLKWILPPYVRPGRKVLVDNDLGTVTIIGVEPGHMGAYRCTAENELGTDEKTVQLTVIHKHVISHPQQPINEPASSSKPSIAPSRSKSRSTLGIKDSDLIIIIACSGAIIVIAAVSTLVIFVLMTRHPPPRSKIKRQPSPQVNTDSTTGTISTHSPSQTLQSDEEMHPTFL